MKHPESLELLHEDHPNKDAIPPPEASRQDQELRSPHVDSGLSNCLHLQPELGTAPSNTQPLQVTSIMDLVE